MVCDIPAILCTTPAFRDRVEPTGREENKRRKKDTHHWLTIGFLQFDHGFYAAGEEMYAAEKMS